MNDDKTTKAKAAAMWRDMDNNERHGVRFGLFPAVKMVDAEQEGFNGRELCLELMNCAKVNGGMIA